MQSRPNRQRDFFLPLRPSGVAAAAQRQVYSSGSERVYGRAVVPEGIWINF